MSRIYGGIGIAVWRYFYPLDSMTDLRYPIPGAERRGADWSRKGCYGTDPKISRRGSSQGGRSQGLNNRREFSTTVVERFVATKKTVGAERADPIPPGRAVARKPHSGFRIAGAPWAAGGVAGRSAMAARRKKSVWEERWRGLLGAWGANVGAANLVDCNSLPAALSSNG